VAIYLKGCFASWSNGENDDPRVQANTIDPNVAMPRFIEIKPIKNETPKLSTKNKIAQQNLF